MDTDCIVALGRSDENRGIRQRLLDCYLFLSIYSTPYLTKACPYIFLFVKTPRLQRNPSETYWMIFMN